MDPTELKMLMLEYRAYTKLGAATLHFAAASGQCHCEQSEQIINQRFIYISLFTRRVRLPLFEYLISRRHSLLKSYRIISGRGWPTLHYYHIEKSAVLNRYNTFTHIRLRTTGLGHLAATCGSSTPVSACRSLRSLFTHRVRLPLFESLISRRHSLL